MRKASSRAYLADHMNAGPAFDLFQTIQAQIGQSFWRLSDEKIERDDDKEDFGHVQFGDDKVSLSLSAASGESDMTFRWASWLDVVLTR